MKKIFYSKKMAMLISGFAIFLFVGAGLIVRANKTNGKTIHIPKPNLMGWSQLSQIRAKIDIANHTVMKNSDGKIYLQLDVEALNKVADAKTDHKPTDFVVVLDRSGSMSGNKKMEYAHQAIESLLNQMTKKDRITLVTFDDRIETPIEMTYVNAKNKKDLVARVREISPRGSTNLSGGLMKGINVLQKKDTLNDQAKRIILLSDGLANVGITNPSQIKAFVSKAANQDIFISTIGLGLDFNEVMMSSIADFGAGRYYFMESLGGLETILAKEFYSASQIYAKNLKLELNLPKLAKLVDASGYPFEQSGHKYVVKAGNLYFGQKKSFFVALQVPTDEVFSEYIGKVSLDYSVNDKSNSIVLNTEERIMIGCLPEYQKKEYTASINKSLFQKVWTKYNYGQFMKDSSRSISRGDKSTAIKTLGQYRKKLKVAYEAAPSSELKKQIDDLDEEEAKINDAFEGSDQGVKQRKLSKGYHYSGGNIQRQSKK